MSYGNLNRLQCANGRGVGIELQLEPDAPHRITALWVRPASTGAPAAGDVASALRAMTEPAPEEASVLVAAWRGKEVEVLAAHRADQARAIASVAKLCTLSALLHGVADRAWSWDTVLRLQDADRSLPSGPLGTWPTDSPLTLQTLVMQLMGDSDNTANDLLLRELSARGRWPAAQDPLLDGVCGRPVLRTRDYFVLRALPEPPVPPASLPSWPLDRLAQEFAAHGAHRPPVVGWSASARDLLGLMQRLAQQLGHETAAPARAIFQGLAQRAPLLAAFKAAAAKGGSDFGVFTQAMLLQRAEGEHLVVLALWNGHSAAPPMTWHEGLQRLLQALQAVP